MILNRTYGFWSAITSVIGLLLLIAPYTFADGPEGFEAVLIQTMMILSTILLLAGIVTSGLAIRKKESGIKKYTGILIPVLIILFIVLVPVFMAVVL